MNVCEVLDTEVLETVEQSLLSRQLSSLERFILCQSWLGRGYSEMASDCAYSIAHIKDIGSQLWQALSKVLRERVTKKNLFLVLKQYLISRTGETAVSDQLSVTLELVELANSPLTPTTNQLPVTADFVEASYSEDSEQLLRLSDRCELLIEESSQLERVQQQCQTSCDNTEAENNFKAPIVHSEPTNSSACLPLDFPLYINPPPIAELTYNEISQSGCSIGIKTPRVQGKNSLLYSLLSRILNRGTHCGYKTVCLDFQEADVTVSAELNEFLGWLAQK
jgi:AAA-like domain